MNQALLARIKANDPTLTRITFNDLVFNHQRDNEPFDYREMAIIAAAIGQNSMLTHVDLSVPGNSSPAFKEIPSEILEAFSLPQLQVLNLANYTPSARGQTNYFKSVQRMSHLDSFTIFLYIRDHNIAKSALDSIDKTFLNNISSVTFKYFASRLQESMQMVDNYVPPKNLQLSETPVKPENNSHSQVVALVRPSWEVFIAPNKAMIGRLNLTTLRRIYENDPQFAEVTLDHLLNYTNEKSASEKVITLAELKLFSQCMENNDYVNAIDLSVNESHRLIVPVDADVIRPLLRPQLSELNLYNFRMNKPALLYGQFPGLLPNLRIFAHALYGNPDLLKGEHLGVPHGFLEFFDTNFYENVIQKKLLSYSCNFNDPRFTSEFNAFNTKAQQAVSSNVLHYEARKSAFLYLLVSLILSTSEEQPYRNVPAPIWVEILSYVFQDIHKTDNQLRNAAEFLLDKKHEIVSERSVKQKYTPFIITEKRDGTFFLSFKPIGSSNIEQKVETKEESKPKPMIEEESGPSRTKKPKMTKP